MRVITYCPACQTQFFASEEQLNQHDGKVRCGHCLHIFDAKSQLVAVATISVKDANTTSISFKDIISPTDASTGNQKSSSTTTMPAAEITPISDANSLVSSNINQGSLLWNIEKKSRSNNKKSEIPSQRWLWTIASLILFLSTCLSSIYLLRNEIAVYYPKLKPYLLKACQPLECSFELPKKIDLIVIDDSDMLEDAEHAGLVRFSSKLINTGSYVLQYPNLELTLTDLDDKPVLRRIFKPMEYLSAGINMSEGFRASEEVTINLAITTNDIAVSGYRVFVTY